MNTAEIRDYVKMWESIYRRAVEKSSNVDLAAEEGLWLTKKILEYIDGGKEE